MRFVIKNRTRDNTGVLMRRLGYHFLGQDEKLGQWSFVKPISQTPYPRFHIYLRENKETDEVSMNLHLDQKKPSYQGAKAHSGEYEGELVAQEAERIRQIFNG